MSKFNWHSEPLSDQTIITKDLKTHKMYGVISDHISGKVGKTIESLWLGLKTMMEKL